MSAIQAGAVLYAKEPEKVAAFYREVANMHVCHIDSQYIELQSNSFQLVVLQIPKRIASSIVIASPPVRREEGAIKLVLFTQSIAGARVAAARFGGALNGPEREWLFQGHIVCDGHDPEGNVFQLRQRSNEQH
jgi:hypothetical protein